MRELTKAQLTVGLLACFAMVWGLAQQALNASDQIYAFAIVILQLVAIIILSIIILGILEWIKIFDLKTNSILTLIVLVTIRLLSTV
jgi:hypothetical protein